MTQNSCILSQGFTSYMYMLLGDIGTPAGLTMECGFYSGGWRNGPNMYSLMITDVWLNIIVTWNGTNLVQYVNGSLNATTPMSNTSVSSGLPHHIGGRWDAAAYMTGQIGELRIYGTAFTLSQVTTLYNQTASAYTV